MVGRYDPNLEHVMMSERTQYTLSVSCKGREKGFPFSFAGVNMLEHT